MVIYLIILLFILLISIRDPYEMKFFDKIFFITLTAISGFRYDVGTDFFGYVDYFNSIRNGEVTPAEIGFVIISKTLTSFQLGSQSMFMVYSALTMLFIYKGLKFFMKENYALKPVLYILMVIFTYFPSLNGVRQALAAAILFYASQYIIEKDFKRFTLWVCISVTFHLSSIFYIIVYFIGPINYKKFTMLFVILLSFVFAQLGIVSKNLEFLYLNLSFLDVGGYLENYLYHSYNNREIQFGIVFYINLMVLLLFIFIKDRIIINKKSLFTFNLFYFFVLINIWSMDAAMLSRLTYFFSIYMAITISRFGIIFDKNSRRIVEYVLIFLYSLLFLYLILNGFLNPGKADYIPYNFNTNFLK